MNNLPEVVEFYHEVIDKALRINADIIVYTSDGGPAYVREVKGYRIAPQTLSIGPVSDKEMRQLRSYIRSRMAVMGLNTVNQILGPEQISARFGVSNAKH
jgi:hypothetical protein